MIVAYVEHLRSLLHGTFVGQHPWLEAFLLSLLDFVSGPFTGLRTRTYWPEVVCAVIIAALVFVLRDRRAGQGIRDFFRYLFPRRMFIHQSTGVDCKLILANHFVTPAINITWRLGTPLFVGGVVAGLTAIFGPAPHFLRWSTPTIIFYTILFGLADDFGYYIFHLLSHRVPFLWAFHKVHHSAETLQVFANVRVHPVEVILTSPFKAAMTSLVMGPALYLGTGDAPFATVLGMNIVNAFYGLVGSQLHHSHIWLSWGPVLERVFVSPAMHQIHHSTARRHWNRNMGGNFAIWDWMFGTQYIPRGKEDITFGLGDGKPQPHPTLLAAYLVPFWEIMPMKDRLQPVLTPLLRLLPSSARRVFLEPEILH